MSGTVDTSATAPEVQQPKKIPLYKQLYFQVICAIIIGVVTGVLFPKIGEDLRPLGDIFIKLVKLLIGPIIFLTVVHGIASMRDMKQVGRIGVKALIYFEVMTTVALVIGLVGMNLLKPGAGLNIDVASLDAGAMAQYSSKAKDMTFLAYIMHLVPSTFIGAFAEGDILQILLISLIFAFALHGLGDYGTPILDLIDRTTGVFFGMVRLVMYLSPIGAFGAMAFTIGKYGLGTLWSLAGFLFSFYLICGVFVFGVLGLVAYFAGFSLWKFLRYIKEELLLVLGTSSSESALPRLMAKLELLGCEKTTVGLVVPAGYSFNLDGSCIMMTTMAIFVAQALNINLSLSQELGLIGLMLLTSKGAGGVTGGAFVALAATLASTNVIPVAGLTLVLGVYRFVSEIGSLVNLTGNGVATLVVAKWEGTLNVAQMHQHLNGETDLEANEPELALRH